MKKFKKLIAGLSAAAIAMTVGVSAFAAVEGKAKASYENGYVRLSNTSDIIDISGTKQWTVVIIPKEKQLSTLSNSDLLYINQGTNVETFWTGTTTTNADSTTTVSGGMGVKGGKLDDGDYIVRIGGETITDASKVIEIALKVSSTPTTKTYTYGDVNNDTKIDMKDVKQITYYFNDLESIFDDGAAWRITAADVNKDTKADIKDAKQITYYFNDLESVFDNMESMTFTVNE